MIIRELDAEHDFTWGQGRANYLTRNRAIGQNAQCRVLSWLGDCYFALRDGIDWLTLFGSPGKKVAIELAVNGALLNSEGITDVKAIYVIGNPVTRRISLSYACDSIYTGVTNVADPQGEIAANYLLDSNGNIITDSDGNGIETT